ncbi:MAG: hypothetical protein ACK4Z4_00165 [Ferrovibrio sp.]
MSSSDAEIYRTARDLIADYGARGAESHANRQLTEMTLGSNFVGMLVWRRILRAIKGMNTASASSSAASRRR